MQRGLRARGGDRLAELVEAGSFARARERALLRTEGRDYVVADGDVLTIRFTRSSERAR